MKLIFRIHGLPAEDGELKSIGCDNILMVQIWNGQLWYLWDAEAEYRSDREGYKKFKLKKIG